MDPIIKKNEERLEWLSSDEETRQLYEYREYSRIEYNSKMHDAKKNGLERGLEKGIEEGIEEGFDQANKKTAQKLLRLGMTVQQVAEMTELSVDEVRKLDKL